jgi:hypothetical protein
MRYQDQLVRQTQKALDDVCRSALAVPSEKLDWKPLGEIRSVLGQMQEVADSATFIVPVIQEGRVPDFGESTASAEKNSTVESCVEAARTSTGLICQLISQFPDARLEDELTLPFGGGMKMTAADVLGLHYWNLVYHLGQINQIQLMLGDKMMH